MLDKPIAKAALIFAVSSFFLVTIFYVYPAEVFEADITVYAPTYVDGERTYQGYLAFTQILGKSELPDFINQSDLVSIKMNIKGWLVMFVIFIGLPVMIAWRVVLKKPFPAPRKGDYEDEEDHAFESEDFDSND